MEAFKDTLPIVCNGFKTNVRVVFTTVEGPLHINGLVVSTTDGELFVLTNELFLNKFWFGKFEINLWAKATKNPKPWE